MSSTSPRAVTVQSNPSKSNSKSNPVTPTSSMAAEAAKFNRETTRDPNDYEPYDHREVDKPTSYCETLVHLIKNVLGTGILTLPRAVYNAGCVLGFFGTFLLGYISIHSVQTLIKTMHLMSKEERVPLLTYPQTVALAVRKRKWPSWLETFSVCTVNALVLLFQIGCGCVYIVYVATTLRLAILEQFHEDVSITVYMGFLLLPVLAIMTIRNLKMLAPVSILANVLISLSLLIIIYLFLSDLPKEFDVRLFGDVLSLPSVVSTLLFSINGVPVLIALENNMKTPKSFVGLTGVLHVGLTIVTCSYGIFGLLGYLRFGSNVISPVTDNLPSGTLSNVVRFFYAASILMSYPLQVYVPVEIIWGWLHPWLVKRNATRFLLWEYALRYALVFFTFFIAKVIPKLGPLIDLCGALCLSVLGVCCPMLLDLCNIHPNYGTLKWKLVKNIIIFMFGFIALVTGTVNAFIDMAA